MRKLALALLLGSGALGEQQLEPKKPGSEAPVFELAALDGKTVTSAELRGDAASKNVVVVIFWAYTCPWVQRWNPTLDALVRDYAKQGAVKFVVVDSDKNETRDPAAIKKHLESQKLDLPVYLDAGNKVADTFGAKVTPHCFVIGRDGLIAYSGRIDNQNPFGAEGPAAGAAPKPAEPKNALLKKAIDAALDGKQPEIATDVPMGCRLKRQ